VTLGLPGAVRLRRHATSDARWEAATRQPHARLAPLLCGPYLGWTEETLRPLPRRELPFPGLPLILGFGSRFRLADTRRPVNAAMRVGSFVAGLDDWYTESLSPSGTRALQVNLTPLGARLIFGLPLEALTRQIVPITDFLGADGARLEMQVASESTWEARFDRLEQWLLARLSAAREPSGEISWIWRELDRSRGTASIGTLATSLGWSRQRMVTQCRHELGLSPKLLARIVRFSTMTERLRRGRTGSWSALAAECGYYDQSHLIREVHEFAGCTPLELPGHLLPQPT
jgi:AraC-like DNA-binding protein